MKIRNGFVSNSSTSSFVCAACGCVEAGRDMGLSDFEMFQCEDGHKVHMECAGLSSLEVPEEFLMKYVEKYCDPEDTQEVMEEVKEDAKHEFIYEVPIEYCPICQLEILKEEDELKYYHQKFGTTSKETLKEIKEKFNNYKEFKSKIYQ